MSGRIITTGASGLQGSVAPRIESHDLVKNEKLWSLYIQAMQRMYDSKENEMDSHFQIGGIHGLPYVQWDGAGGEQPVGAPAGYCQHSTVIFPTWHRPYCALYEQILHRHAVQVAATYTVDQAAWKQAAEDFRIPYWDWASQPLPPKQFYDHQQYSQVTITTHDGSKKPVNNPLLAYKFQSGQGPAPPKGTPSGSTYDVLSKLPWTIRHPTRPIGPNSKTDIASFESVLKREYEDTRPDTATLLLEVKDWFGFSTQAADQGAFTRSLEAIHGTMHVKIGFSGHMNYVPYAAFDPIFWMHHCNVDRMIALWQYINYKVWVSARNDSGTTWVTKPGNRVDENTQLAPFRIDESNFWTSAQCRAPMNLRYTYADFQGLDMNDLPAVSKAIHDRVTKLYYDKDTFAAFPGLVPSAQPAPAPPAHGQAPLGIKAAGAHLASAVAEATSHLASGSSHRGAESIEWTCRIRGNQEDFRGITSILIFLDGIPEDAFGFMTDPRYVGSYDPFVNPFPKLCQNCMDGSGIKIEGFVHMTYSLKKRGLNVHDIPAVEEYCRKNLKWIPLVHHGEFGRVEDVKSLEVTVIDTPLTAVEGSSIPRIGLLRKHNEITFDLPGGRIRVPGHA